MTSFRIGKQSNSLPQPPPHPKISEMWDALCGIPKLWHKAQLSPYFILQSEPEKLGWLVSILKLSIIGLRHKSVKLPPPILLFTAQRAAWESLDRSRHHHQLCMLSGL